MNEAILYRKNRLDKIFKHLNRYEDHIDFNFSINYNHINTRLKERNVNFTVFLDRLEQFSKYNIMQFMYLAHLPDDITPFRIYLNFDDVIICLSKNDFEYGVRWKVNTILNPNKHNLYKENSSLEKNINLREQHDIN